MDPDSLVDRLLYFLAEQGFVTGPDTGSDSYSVSQMQGDTLRLSPRLVVTEDVLFEYIDRLASSFGGSDRSRDEALSIVMINVVEEFDVDHGEGNNYAQVVGFRRDRASGQAEMYVEQNIPRRDLTRGEDDVLEWRAERPTGRS